MSATIEPSSTQLEDALRGEVARCFKQHDMDNLTLKRVRAIAEETLNLSSGWFKQHEEWNQKSKSIVSEEVTRCQEQDDERDESDEYSEPLKRAKSSAGSSGIEKRKSPGSSAHPEKKRRKDVDETSAVKRNAEKYSSRDDDSSSLSEVLDPSPPRRGKKTKSPKKGKPSKVSPTKSVGKKQSKSATANLSSDEAEIKMLQSWLVKCGVRKVWGKELVRFDTSSEKIGHLKSLLHDVGMEGRFSEEKAKKIKEARELAADLAEIQQGEKYWGMTADEEGARGGRRRLSRAKAPVAAPSESSQSSESGGETEKPDVDAKDSDASE